MRSSIGEPTSADASLRPSPSAPATFARSSSERIATKPVVGLLDPARPRRVQRRGDEREGVRVVGEQVDLLAEQVSHQADARAALADADADRRGAAALVAARRDGDLGAHTGDAGDADELDPAVAHLADLAGEDRLDEARVGLGQA